MVLATWEMLREDKKIIWAQEFGQNSETVLFVGEKVYGVHEDKGIETVVKTVLTHSL